VNDCITAKLLLVFASTVILGFEAKGTESYFICCWLLPYEYSLGMEFTEKSAFIKVFDY
jgi:hypothetical protein